MNEIVNISEKIIVGIDSRDETGRREINERKILEFESWDKNKRYGKDRRRMFENVCRCMRMSEDIWEYLRISNFI